MILARREKILKSSRSAKEEKRRWARRKNEKIISQIFEQNNTIHHWKGIIIFKWPYCWRQHHVTSRLKHRDAMLTFKMIIHMWKRFSRWCNWQSLFQIILFQRFFFWLTEKLRPFSRKEILRKKRFEQMFKKMQC